MGFEPVLQNIHIAVTHLNHQALGRVTSVRENQGESGNIKVPFSNQGRSRKIDLLEKIREKSGNLIMYQGKIREFRYSFYLVFFRIPNKISLAPSALKLYKYFLNTQARAVGARILTKFSYSLLKSNILDPGKNQGKSG